MKTTTLYWIFTILIAAFMGLTAIPNVMMTPESVTFMKHLGYPDYFIPFIGMTKIIGSIALLIPGFPRIKEWAYAGLTFDLIGAVYSLVAVEGFQPQMAFMLLFFVLLGLSYYFYHKKIKAV